MELITKYNKMIEIVKSKPKKKKKRDPYYTLKYKYMIGDADGKTSQRCYISVDNPYVERYVKLVNSLKPTEGYWGIMLEEDRLVEHLNEKQITEDDYKFLLRMMFEGCEDEFKVEEENEDHSYEFFEGVQSETEHSFLVFEGVTLTYVDEYGTKHKTKIK